jgi:hypothetical protein
MDSDWQTSSHVTITWEVSKAELKLLRNAGKNGSSLNNLVASKIVLQQSEDNTSRQGDWVVVAVHLTIDCQWHYHGTLCSRVP